MNKSNSLILHIFLFIVGIIVCIPFLWSISCSFDRLYTNLLPFPPRVLPLEPTFFNYIVLFKNMDILRHSLNTFYVAFMTTIISIITNTMAAFAISKSRMKFRNAWLMFFLATMMIPGEVRIMGMYKIIKVMNLTNTLTAAFLPGAISGGFLLFLIKSYVDTIPSDFYESASIEGASIYKIYFGIFLPLMKPVVAANAVLVFIGMWNDFLWPLIVIGEDKKRTISVVMANYQHSGVLHPGVATAMSVLSAIPLLFVFLFLQKYIVQSIALSGLKQ